MSSESQTKIFRKNPVFQIFYELIIWGVKKNWMVTVAASLPLLNFGRKLSFDQNFPRQQIVPSLLSILPASPLRKNELSYHCCIIFWILRGINGKGESWWQEFVALAKLGFRKNSKRIKSDYCLSHEMGWAEKGANLIIWEICLKRHRN